MAGKSFQIFSTSQAYSILEELHDRVAQFNQRVILTRKGTDARCILISETELESLERAVAILSETHDGAALHDQVLRIASVVNQLSSLPTHA